MEPAKTCLADIETTAITYGEGGVLIPPDKVHILVAKDFERGKSYAFVGDEEIEKGVRWLETCETVVFHNGRGFDEPVLEKNFGLDTSKAEFLDSLILSRLFYSNLKDEDFILFNKHAAMQPSPFKFTGDLIGSHSLEAWGLRLKHPRPKGNYTEEMKARGIEDPWAEYNEEMHRYAVQDVVVLEGFWQEKILPCLATASTRSVKIEHFMVELMQQVKESGIKFNTARAHELVAELETERDKLYHILQEDFPPRLEPVKWVLKEVPEALGNQYPALIKSFPKNKIYRPQFNLPHGYEREMWGEPSFPKVKRTVKFKNDTATYNVLPYEPLEGLPCGNNAYTKCEVTEFNPASRQDVTRRLLEMGWEPEEFTEAGSPVTNEAELAKIEEQFPTAKNIVKYLLVEKRLGALKTGDKAWLNLVSSQDFIHPTIKPCATVTFRAAHADPNISQVPAIKMVPVLDAQGNKVTKVGKDGTVKEVFEVGKGAAGKWGYDCRELFTVPPGFTMVGSDLSGIELRCWAHYLTPYDNGNLAYIILNEDVHESNRVILGFADRTDAKRFLFALIYGAGDEKLGHIINKSASSEAKKLLGRRARARFMAGVTGFEALNDKISLDVNRRKWLHGLDGRRIPVRKPHAALNSLLQSAGAIISKYWILEALRIIEDEHGLRWGYDNDYTLLLYSHDELQFAVRDEHVDIVKQACITAAVRAGERLGMRIPIAAESKSGPHWGATH